MTPAELRLCRSVLFLPASNARAVEKARTLAADAIILDLEDAVPPDDKAAAREAAVAALEAGFGGRPAGIRVNGAGSEWFGDDVVAVRASRADFVVVPKAEAHKQAADAHWLTQLPVLAMIETAAGVLAAAAIAPATIGLIAGTNDLAADLGLSEAEDRAGLALSLQAILLAARAARVAAFDGVYNRLEDDAGLERQCREGRALGFDGKTLVHPSQIETANRLFGPSEAELADAQRLIAAATGGAERHEGRMIEAMHVEQARAALAKARP